MADPFHILIVEARFYDDIADELVQGAQATLNAASATFETVAVPGAYELPAAVRMAMESGCFDGYIALGCVIRGETTHYETVCNDSSRALQLLGLQGLCIGNGILTVENEIQAQVRADPAQKNKGGEAAQAAMALLDIAGKFAR